MNAVAPNLAGQREAPLGEEELAPLPPPPPASPVSVIEGAPLAPTAWQSWSAEELAYFLEARPAVREFAPRLRANDIDGGRSPLATTARQKGSGRRKALG